MLKIQKIKSLFIRNVLLALLFGGLIASITSVVNYNMKFVEIEQQVQKDVKFDSTRIKLFIKSYLDNIENNINSIQTNQLFINYLNDPSISNREFSTHLLTSLIKSNKNLFQLRFLDQNGLEKIRIEKEKHSDVVYSVDEENLQNKSSRYYFEETIKNDIGSFWYSRFDLNIEEGKLEEPIRPTLRISTNVFYKGDFYGILIANVDMDGLLSQIKSNNHFNIYLIDGEGNFLLHPLQEKSWNKYLNSGHTIFSEFISMSQNSFELNNFGESRYVFSLEDYFKNNENIKLILEADNSYLETIKENNLNYIYILGSAVLVISLVVGFLVSIPVSKLYLDFNKLYKDNLRFIDIIDEYVVTTTVNLDKEITNVSGALCELSGYEKDEIMGKTPAIFKSYDTSEEVYKTLWNKISSGVVWSGELRNKAKDGSYYWLETTILPNFDEKKNIESYTSISQNTTDKKIIEKLSQTDKLTQLYNRVKLDEYLESEFNRYKRGNYTFSIMIIDIDKFKDVNDIHGHQVGDTVLVEMANILKVHCRKTDMVGRWGGEEFMLICSNTDINGATTYAQNLRKTVEKFNFSVVGQKTISIGVSQINKDDTFTTLIQRADNNLYRAKEEGRNRVVATDA